MALLHMVLCVVFMVTAVVSKPVCLNEGEVSSKSSESSESNSSEETVVHIGSSEDHPQPEFTETDMPNAIETDSPDTVNQIPSADLGLSPTTLNTSALPDLEDPQTSTDTDAAQLLPDDPSNTALGVDISQDMPDPAQDSVNADTVRVLSDTETDMNIGTGSTSQPPSVTTTTTYQGFSQGSTPPSSPHNTKQPLPPFSTTPPLKVPVGTTLVPVCFTFQFGEPETNPPRGDSI